MKKQILLTNYYSMTTYIKNVSESFYSITADRFQKFTHKLFFEIQESFVSTICR